jgi:hypothetical protein
LHGADAAEVPVRQHILVTVLVLLAAAPLHAESIRIVDTGPGPADLPGFSLFSGQWVAAEFEVLNPAVITDVQGWMLVSGSGLLDLALYQGGAAVPGALLFRSTGFINSGSADWKGLSGLSWFVTPGSYWMAFEPPRVVGMGGAMPYPTEHPLANGATAHSESRFRYFESDEAGQIGLRILAESTPAPIPEPASMLLLATGLAGLLVPRCRRKPVN